MQYLDYNRLQIILQDFFNRFGDCPELDSISTNRKCGYFEIVRFFGPDGIDPGEVSVELQDQLYEFSDDRIARFSKEIESAMTAEGRLHAGPEVLKLVVIDIIGTSKYLIVQPCRYGHQAGSCFALDYSHPLFDGFGGCLREYYLSRSQSRAICDNPLAICLGVSACVVVQWEDERLVLFFRRKKARLVSLESSYGPAVAGAVDIGHLGGNLYELLQRAISAETSEELGLTPPEYRLVPLGYGREIYRGERPQLFAALMIDLPFEKLSERLDKLDPAITEFDDYIFLPLRVNSGIEAGETGQLNFEAAMNLLLLREYIDQQQP